MCFYALCFNNLSVVKLSAATLQVVFGGGRDLFRPQADYVPSGNPFDDRNRDLCKRIGNNLIEEWKNITNGVYISNKTQLMELNVEETEQVLGKCVSI
jgi:alkaline phosphatase